MFKEYYDWTRLIKCDAVGKLNSIIYNRQIDNIKCVSEGLHSDKLVSIVKGLCKACGTKRVITVAGLSSSNKITFALRLSIALRAYGYSMLGFEMDDYYKSQADIPFQPDGHKDFEGVDALNISKLTENTHKLLAGETILKHKFDFKTGVDVDIPEKLLKMPPNLFLVIEGISGLNPQLLDAIGREFVTPVYISALTPVNLDFNHRFPTSNLRLFRRIIRDYQFSSISQCETIQRWTSIRID
jgi:uridine kinase